MKLRLLVLAEIWRPTSLSGFMPRHIEQPACRHSKPAARNTSSSPSASACAFTCCEPGTTMALTLSATRPFFAISAAERRSLNRELVQLPMKTTSTGTSVIFWPGRRSMWA